MVATAPKFFEVAKQIVEGHQGKIWAESEGADKGSVFYVELDAVE